MYFAFTIQYTSVNSYFLCLDKNDWLIGNTDNGNEFYTQIWIFYVVVIVFMLHSERFPWFVVKHEFMGWTRETEVRKFIRTIEFEWDKTIWLLCR